MPARNCLFTLGVRRHLAVLDEEGQQVQGIGGQGEQQQVAADGGDADAGVAQQQL